MRRVELLIDTVNYPKADSWGAFSLSSVEPTQTLAVRLTLRQLFARQRTQRKSVPLCVADGMLWTRLDALALLALRRGRLPEAARIAGRSFAIDQRRSGRRLRLLVFQLFRETTAESGLNRQNARRQFYTKNDASPYTAVISRKSCSVAASGSCRSASYSVT